MFAHIRSVVRFAAISATIATISLATSCGDESTIGNSIVEDDVQIFIDSTFTLTGHTVETKGVRSRTIVQILGDMDMPGFGHWSSDVVTQFMPSIALDTTGVKIENVDSIRLVMGYARDGFTGDSIAPMGIRAYRLTKNLPNPIFSDFDPTGYYDSSAPLGSVVYNPAARVDTLSLITTNKYISIKFPRELALELYQAYLDNPSVYASPTQFNDRVFKGLYLQTSYGSGRVVRISETYMNLYYHVVQKVENTDRDTTIVKMGNYFAVTPEIITNNNIRLNRAKNIDSDITEGQTLLVAPVGTEAEVVFPAREIISKYRAAMSKGLAVINSLSMSIKAHPVANDQNITPPPYILLVLKKDKEAFFADNKITDDETSFYGTYNSSTGTYDFRNMRPYLLSLIEKESITDDDVTFSVVPVNVEVETTSTDYYGGTTTTVTAITPFVSYPVMAKIDYKNTKIKLTYSRQTINN